MVFGEVDSSYPQLYRIAQGWPIHVGAIEYRGKPAEQVQENLMRAGIAIDLGVSKVAVVPGESIAK